MKTIFTFFTIFLFAFQANAQCWQSVTSGLTHSMGIKTDGSLWAWGKNDYGQLGDGTLINKYIPTQIGNATNWKTVSCGNNFTVAIQTNGTLWSWGDNLKGQLGNGTLVHTLTPTQVGSDTTWDSIDCGYYFCVALKGSFSKSLWTWGFNEYGQLGNGNNTDTNTPQQIGLSTNWRSVSAGAYHAIALEFVNGGSRLMAWGINQYGQLGDNTVLSKNIPTQIGTDVNWQTAVTGYFHSLAKKTTGTLWAWGYNGDGQLGSGNNINIYFPTQITTDTNWQGVLAAGYYHSMVKKTDGTLWVMGRNTYKELGIPAQVYTYIPKQMGTSTDWGNTISGSSGFSLALRQDGNLYSWGSGIDGQLGIGNISLNAPSPALITCPPTLSIKDNNFESTTFSVYPNPANDFVTIKSNYNETISSLKIIDVLGKTVFIQNNNETINIQNLTKGIYVIQISTENINYIQKLIKN